MILTVWKLEELRSTEASQTHQNSSLSFVSTYDSIDNDSVKTRFSDLEPVYLVARIHTVFAIVFENNDWTISSQNGFVCSWLALLLLRCRFKYMISNAKSYRDFRETRAPGTVAGRSKINRAGQEPITVVQIVEIGREMESWRGREEASFAVFLPTPSPSMCFPAHFFLHSPRYLNTWKWLNWVTRVAKDCDWLVPFLFATPKILNVYRRPLPWEKISPRFFWREGGLCTQVTIIKFWVISGVGTLIFFLEHASLLLKTIPNLSLVLFNSQCKFVFLRCFRTFHKLLP